MKLRDYVLEQLATMVVGDHQAFPYRSSMFISQIFDRAELPYRHDGSTRSHWTSDVLKELNKQPSSNLDLPTESILRIIFELFADEDHFDRRSCDRGPALVALNELLKKQSLEAYFDETGSCYVRNTGTGVSSRSSKPLEVRPLSKEELKAREKIALFLDTASEDEFTEKLLVPYFQELGFHRVSPGGHQEKLLESNFSRSLKVLKEKGILIDAPAAGYDGRPKLRIKGELLEQSNSSEPEVDAAEAERLLYDATSVFLKELYMVHASLLVYRIVGVNAKKYRGAGAEFINFTQMLAQRTIVIGFESFFEKLGDGAGLCSVQGLMKLARSLSIKNKIALTKFLTKYGVEPTDNWYSDVQKVLQNQRPHIWKSIKLTSALRNERIAHLAHPITPRQYTLPSIAETENVIEFAHDFYSFITVGFLNSSSGADLRHSIGYSLVALLRERFGVADAKFDFDEQLLPASK